jgi:hypothetical protein
MNPSVKIFAGTGSQALAEKIAQRFGAPIGKINIQKFSDGEFQPIFLESIRGDYVFLVQSTYAPSENIMELLMMIDAAKRASAYKIIVVIPYYGFARQDRKDKPRVAIGAKLIATLLEAAGAHRVITMDLHAAQIQGFFEVPVDHLDSSAIFIPYIGYGVALVLALLSAILQAETGVSTLAVLALYVAGQAIESFFLTPKLVGERIGLHPVLVVFALILFGGWFGFFGVLLALPLSAIALVLSRHAMQRYKNSNWYKNN